MSENKPAIWICSWSKCRKMSKKNSVNGFCQKCFEGTLIPFVQYAELEELQSELATLKADWEMMRDCLQEMADEDFRGNRPNHSVKAFQKLKELKFKLATAKDEGEV